MPPTREQRDAHALCGAKTKTGTSCRMFAGQGTSHVGTGSCFRHGGNTPSHVKAAAAVVVQQRLHAEAESLSDDDSQPHRILRELLKQTGGRLRWLNAELARDHSATAERLFKEERQFLSWISKLASEVDLEAVEARVRASEAALVATMVRESLTRLGLDDKVIEAVGVAFRTIAAEAKGETDAAEREGERLDRLREEIAADDHRRIEREAQRQVGLVPAAEIAPGEDTGFLNPAA